jgi:hypothetical protein
MGFQIVVGIYKFLKLGLHFRRQVDFLAFFRLFDGKSSFVKAIHYGGAGN